MLARAKSNVDDFEHRKRNGMENKIAHLQMIQAVITRLAENSFMIKRWSKARVDHRVQEMKSDDNSRYLIYRVLGVADDEGKLIDVYQNYLGALVVEGSARVEAAR